MQCIAEGFNQAEFIRVIPMLGIAQQMIPGNILFGQPIRVVSIRPIIRPKNRNSTPMLRVTFDHSWFGIAAECYSASYSVSHIRRRISCAVGCVIINLLQSMYWSLLIMLFAMTIFYYICANISISIYNIFTQVYLSGFYIYANSNMRYNYVIMEEV